MWNKKIRIKILLLAIFSSILVFQNNVIADDLDSGSYKIKDFSVGSEGGVDQTSSSGYRVMISMGDPINHEKLTSTTYELGIGTGQVWTATAPSIKCFETTTDGTTSCDDISVTPDGMVMICGDGGCFDRARFELNNENNPSDTLYSIQITTDISWTTYNYIDGTTFLIETSSTHDINDYQLESTWEGTASNINILGLEQGTTYYLRATALNGDFTESGPGPSTNATTGYASISFDIDIAGTGGSSSETSSPYSIDLGTLELGTVSIASDLFWLDFGTNLTEGGQIYIRDQYAGLFSATNSYTLSSADADLDSTSGFGIQNYSVNENYLGPLIAHSPYNGATNNVGGLIDEIYSKLLLSTSASPIDGARASFYVKARPAETSPYGHDYQDTFILTVTGNI